MPPGWYQNMTEGVALPHLTPVAYFRGLLGMSQAERERLLAAKPAQERALVLAKLREYDAMPRDVREARLFQTELHWYLLSLLPLDPAKRRPAVLKSISPLYQPAILQQLQEWDQLSAEMRKALLEKESFLLTYLQWRGHSPQAQADLLNKLPPDQRARWTEELTRWEGMPERRRDELCAAFRRFFGSTGEQREQTTQGLTDAERRQMEQTLKTYASLPPDTQRVCLNSFSKFARMSQGERNQFLQNAAKWEAMTPSERELWRMLVTHLPPLPPDIYQPQSPPMPPGWHAPPVDHGRLSMTN
jgi:hypothetical protein